MTSDEREKFRWQFAGQAMAATLVHYERFPDPDEINLGMAECVTCADALIAELEKTQPVDKEEQRCRHDYHRVPVGLACTKCGVLK